MKLRVIQEGPVVIMTVLDISESLKHKFKKKDLQVIQENLDDYLGICLLSTNNNSTTFYIKRTKIQISIHSIGIVNTIRFFTFEEARRYVKKLKNSIRLLNHGTEAEIIEANKSIHDVKISILE